MTKYKIKNNLSNKDTAIICDGDIIELEPIDECKPTFFNNQARDEPKEQSLEEKFETHLSLMYCSNQT